MKLSVVAVASLLVRADVVATHEALLGQLLQAGDPKLIAGYRVPDERDFTGAWERAPNWNFKVQPHLVLLDIDGDHLEETFIVLVPMGGEGYRVLGTFPVGPPYNSGPSAMVLLESHRGKPQLVRLLPAADGRAIQVIVNGGRAVFRWNRRFKTYERMNTGPSNDQMQRTRPAQASEPRR